MEFALVLPVFLLLLGGIVEFGQAFRIQHSLSNAARRGARSAIVADASYSTVVAKTKQQCVQTLGVAESIVEVTVSVNGVAVETLSAATTGDEMTVAVRLPYSAAGATFFSQTFSGRSLQSSCTFQHE